DAPRRAQPSRSRRSDAARGTLRRRVRPRRSSLARYGGRAAYGSCRAARPARTSTSTRDRRSKPGRSRSGPGFASRDPPRAARSWVALGRVPDGERTRDEAYVVVPLEVRDLGPDPCRPRERLMLAVELDLGDDEARVRAVELVDFPFEAFVRHVVPGLLDQRPFRGREQRLGVRDRERILEFLADRLEPADLDVEVRGIAGDPHAHGCALGARDVALAHSCPAHGERPPSVAAHEELALDLLRHASSLRRGVAVIAARGVRSPRTAPSLRRDGCAGTYRARARPAIDNRARRSGFSRRARASQGDTRRTRSCADSRARAGAPEPRRRFAADRARRRPIPADRTASRARRDP